MNIGPGSNVEIILDLDPLKETIDVRRAIIHDVDGERYILSQTTPPARASHVGKDVRVTRLHREGDQLVRHGFRGRLTGIIRDYSLNSFRHAQALDVLKTSPFESYNLRMHYRVRPGSEWSTRVTIDFRPVNLLDISLGGALFSHGGQTPFVFGEAVQVAYRGEDGTRHLIGAVVKRVWEPREGSCAGLQCVAVRFTQMDKDLERELGREIMEIQRSSLCKA